MKVSWKSVWKWTFRFTVTFALVSFMGTTYLYKSTLEEIKRTPIPFKVNHRNGDVAFKLPWQWGTDEYAFMPGLCKNPRDLDL